MNTGDVKIFTHEIGALDNTYDLMFKVPAANYGGGIYVQSIYLNGAGTATIAVLEYGSAGTAAGGTVGTVAGTFTANTPVALTMTATEQDVAAGYWLGVRESTGALSSGHIAISYVMGK